MLFKGKPLLAAVVVSCVPAATLAQQNADNIEELIVTVHRVPVPQRRIASSVAVLRKQDIEMHGNLALLDVLRQLPAVATSSNGGMGQPSSLRIRGEEGFRTLAIIDGIRLSDPAGTQLQPQFEHMLSSDIERVEVLRGPQGLGYGADAGGVVSMVTRQVSDALHTAVEAQGGSYQTRQFGANVGGGNALGDFFVGVTDVSTAGFNIRTTDTALRDEDGYDNNTLHGRVGIDIAEGWRAELTHRRTEGESDYDDCGFGSAEHNCVATYDSTASRAALNFSSDSFTHSLSYASTDTDRDSLAAGSSVFATQSELDRWEYVGSARELGPLDLVFGADHERATMPERQRDNVGYFAEVLSDFSDAWFVSAGARYDDNDDFGDNTSYRLSTAYLLDVDDGELKFKGSIGTGFRAPSLYEIAYNRGPWAYPPASTSGLQQEKSKGYEIGIEYTTASGLSFEAVYFDQQVEDAIIFDLITFSGYQQEFGSSDSRGVELATRIPLAQQWSLQANYTWNPTERPDGTQRLRRPRQLANLGLNWQPRPRVNVNAFLRASKDAIDQPPFGAVVKLDDFVVVDLSASYQVSDNWQLFGRIENAFDEQYQEIIGYRSAGVAAYLGVRMNFAPL